MTTFRWYVVGLLVLFGAYVAVEYYKPKPLDWTPTLSNKDKIPYGTYALFEVLPQVLGSDSVVSVRQPIFNQLLGTDEPEPLDNTPSAQALADTLQAATDTTQHTTAPVTADTAQPTDTLAAAEDVAEADEPTDSVAWATESTSFASNQPTTGYPLSDSAKATYVFVNQTFDCTEAETNALLQFLAAGNEVFIAAESFSALADTLGVKTVPADTSLTAPMPLGGLKTATDSVRLHFLAGRPGAAPVAITLPTAAAHYRVQLTSHTQRQGATLAADAQGRPVLLRLDVGRGHLYVCSVPLALGNYWLLKPRQGEFALAALSYLPTGRPVWWDEYQKQGRAGEQSLLRVVLAHPAMKTAYYLLLVAGLLFVLVAARRRQRVIPTIRPLPNTTLLFTRTVADLYRQARGGRQQIADKKVGLFLDYLRTRFQEPSPDLADAGFRARLSQKAGLPQRRLDELLHPINAARTAPTRTDQELLILSRTIHAFKRESQ